VGNLTTKMQRLKLKPDIISKRNHREVIMYDTGKYELDFQFLYRKDKKKKKDQQMGRFLLLESQILFRDRLKKLALFTMLSKANLIR
jgi:hypothetical protein